jgi:hypothetical protein
VMYQESREGDGVTKQFKLQHPTVLETPTPQVWVDDVPKTIVTDFTVDYVNGIIIFATAPLISARLDFQTSAVVYTDAEIESFLTDAKGNSTYAAALNLMAWAASAAKIARKESLAGGGGPGAITLDTSVTARELREMAKLYMDTFKTSSSAEALDEFGPADGITEVPWTEFSYHDLLAQAFIRELD